MEGLEVETIASSQPKIIYSGVSLTLLGCYLSSMSVICGLYLSRGHLERFGSRLFASSTNLEGCRLSWGGAIVHAGLKSSRLSAASIRVVIIVFSIAGQILPPVVL